MHGIIPKLISIDTYINRIDESVVWISDGQIKYYGTREFNCPSILDIYY